MVFLHCVMILIVPHRQKKKKEKKKTYPYCLHKRKLATILFLLSNVRTSLLETLSYIKTLPKSYSCSTSLDNYFSGYHFHLQETDNDFS